MCLRCCSLRWVSWFLLLIIEWFIPLRSLSPTVTPALPWLLLNSVPRCHIYKYFERFQRWQFYHSHEQPVPMLGNPLSEASFPNMQSEPPLAWCNLRPFPLNLSLLTGDKRKAQVEHTHSLSLLLQVGHPVMEGDQVSQAAPAFHKPKLAGPDSLVVLHGHVMAVKMICSVTFPWHKRSGWQTCRSTNPPSATFYLFYSC